MLISTHIPVGSNPLKHKAGLLTYPFYHAFPISISGKECDKNLLTEWDLQQLVLSRFLTGFPFHLS